ncbi:MAG: ABC transporter ATP-binding protein [Rhodobacteraceae bacterium]|nr:ABC transporter ATP-binding protein [Paracoccaceae bacterium]
MSGNAFVTMKNIGKRWNGQLGVEGITLDIEEGEFVALLGPSGCGKSTTLRLLAGLEVPDEGQIIIDGIDVTGASAAQRNLSMVFQSYALFPHLSVAENVMFGMKVRRVPKKERLAKMHNALDMTGLHGLEDRKPSALSGGQRQRVALARAIVAGRKLCLMDEPLSNLDAKLRAAVRKDIKKLQKDLGMTIVYVTHDQTEAMSMADKVVLMKDGLIEQTGTPEQLYSEPLNTFVAEFVGAPPMALIKGTALQGYADDQTIGIRAEKMRLAPEGGRMACTVTDCEFLGAETFIGLAHESANGLTIKLDGKAHMEIGSKVEITFEDKDLHVFGPTGKRMNNIT